MFWKRTKGSPKTEKGGAFFMLYSRIVYAFLLFLVTNRRSDNDSVGNVEAISVRPQQQQPKNQQHHFAGIGGTTSVHWVSENSILLVGTKKGGIYSSAIGEGNNQDAYNLDSMSVAGNEWNNSDNADENERNRWNELQSNEYKTKYPIYSIAVTSQKTIKRPLPLSSSEDDERFLFCGSGDRWISVWRIANANANGQNPRNQRQDFEFVQKLGPHTGWVKDLVYDDRNRLLHSIGCNCIETWDCSERSADKLDDDDDRSNPISHAAKRTIENSPTMGTTLSSDLLCLCLLPSNAEEVGEDELPRLLVSGGVDGRIHLWLSPTAERTCGTAILDGRNPLHTTLAHDGRVNAIVYSSALNAIFTVGNDGLLCVFRASLNEGFELVSRLEIEEGSQESSSRLTVASVTMDSEEQCTCSLALGSSKGELYFVNAELNAEGGIDTHMEGDCMTVAENSMIYSIASEKYSDATLSCRLWIGHASGLAAVDRSF